MAQYNSNDLIKRITDNEDLIDILMDVEDYLDSNYLYVYKNWIDGEIVDGPKIKKYWITIVLKFDYEKMPDPTGAARLLPHGTKVRYRISKEKVDVEVKNPGDYQPGTKKPKVKTVKIWLVEMSIPRRFVKNLTDEVIELYGHDDHNLEQQATGEDNSNEEDTDDMLHADLMVPK